jgi:branched-chain amino acid transport system substrate-binding protein
MRKAIILVGLLAILYQSVMAAEPATIAAIFAKTGIATAYGAACISGVELAVEEINRQGGVLDRPLKLIVLDNRSTPIDSAIAAKEAVRLQSMAVIGSDWSSHSLATAPVLQKAGIPMISPGSTNPKVTRVGKYIFRVCFLDSFQGTAMARFAYDELAARKAVVLKNVDEDYCLMLAEFFLNAFKAKGGYILLEEYYRGKAVDFEILLKKVKSLQPDVVYVPGYERDSGLLIRQAVSMGIKTTFLGGDGWSNIYQYGKEAVEGGLYSAHWHPEVPSEKSIYIHKISKQLYGKRINSDFTALSYDATTLLADAVKRAGVWDRAKIRNALSETTDFEGVTGTITLDKNGDPRNKEVVILKIEKGKPVYFKTLKPHMNK